MQEIKDTAKDRRKKFYEEFKASGAKNFRQFAKSKGDLTVVRYWQMLSKAEKEANAEEDVQ